jgi:hypothetical protein
MSIDTTLQRVAAINQAISSPAALRALTGGAVAPGANTLSPAASLSTATSSASGAPTFATALAQANGPRSPGSLTPAGGAGGQVLAAAESQIGQTEQPPGSNESPAIAEYRSATAGAIPGAPWCAYFASWAARQAGEPLGAQGQGIGSVSEIWSWAQSTGRAVPNGPGVAPKPGDLIVFGGEHVGIVKEVLPEGSIQTIEGNYENKVSLNVRPAGEASGYVSMS